jgi:nucleotide-binding universal stress UspA family protein
MYSKILVAHDGSAGASKALTAAIALARQSNAALHMISVEELPRFPATVDEVIEEKKDAKRRFDSVLGRARHLAQKESLKLETHVVAGHPVSAIIEFIDKNGFDLLVVGFFGHSALYNRLVGSTTDRLVELAPCSVLVVK